ncbi:hypothetical protein BDP27DRAFT_1424442 [Rhodocollybia butyracea]|uniref:Uncharacterized protein n=1 Tax=Rhodocollybia butyracea TaxID=206335 RepID=A0A9P5U5I5_9AGAR|nr:hypothetical protein BDP27DRAFT_1424442 [Rhodocollybia butyracea]
MSSTSWTPDETPAQLLYERIYLAGLFLGAVGFGVHATLFFSAFKLLYARRQYRREQVFLGYIVVVFMLSNIGNGTNIKFAQQAFIDNRDYPGGPGAYYVEESTALMVVLCNSVYITLTWFQDGLLLYRFFIIFGGNRTFLGLPVFMFIASVVLSCLLIAMLSRPDLTLWSTISVQLALSYGSISIAFNLLVTVLICGRLMVMRQRLKKSDLHQDNHSPYTTVAAMLIESAFIYSATALAVLISLALNSPVQNLWLPLLGQVQSIAPLLIILRVAEGKAWSAETQEMLISTNIRFGTQNMLSGGSDHKVASTPILNTLAPAEAGAYTESEATSEQYDTKSG